MRAARTIDRTSRSPVSGSFVPRRPAGARLHVKQRRHDDAERITRREFLHVVCAARICCREISHRLGISEPLRFVNIRLLTTSSGGRITTGACLSVPSALSRVALCIRRRRRIVLWHFVPRATASSSGNGCQWKTLCDSAQRSRPNRRPAVLSSSSTELIPRPSRAALPRPEQVPASGGTSNIRAGARLIGSEFHAVLKQATSLSQTTDAEAQACRCRSFLIEIQMAHADCSASPPLCRTPKRSASLVYAPTALSA